MRIVMMLIWQAGVTMALRGSCGKSFSLICAEQANELDGLFSALAHRGYSRAELAEGVNQLIKRGVVDTR